MFHVLRFTILLATIWPSSFRTTGAATTPLAVSCKACFVFPHYHGLTRIGDIGTRNSRLACFPSKPRSMFGGRTDSSFPGPNASRNRVTPFSSLGIPIRHTPVDVNLSPAPPVVIMVDFPYVYVPGFYVLLRYMKTYTRVREIWQKLL